MSTSSVCFWKRLWKWTTSETIGEDDILKLLNEKTVTEHLKQGLASYKPLQKDRYAELAMKHPNQTKLLYVAQTMQTFLDLDTFQTWDTLMHYLCEASYGTPEEVLKNVAFLDTRPSHLLPKAWHFYRCERLYLLKLLKYTIEFKDDESHKYHKQFRTVVAGIGLQDIKTSLLSQFLIVIRGTPPSRTPHIELGEDYVKQEWAQYNLWEQLEILQILLLIVDEVSMSDAEFVTVFDLFKKHDFGRKQTFNDLLEQRHRESCMRIMFSEIMLFLVVLDECKIMSVSCWIEGTKDAVESELTKLQLQEEHGAMLLAWMLLTLHSDQHRSHFDGHYQHFGITALRLQVFKFLHHMITNSIFMDDSKCALISRMRVFELLNDTCDKFDGDGSVSQQPGAMKLCGELLSTPHVADLFWSQFRHHEEQGAVSLWNTALEYFPYNFSALSELSCGLARAGQMSVKKLIAELKSLPVYTEIFNPNVIRITNVSIKTGEVVIGQEYYPLNNAYKIEANSSAAVMERKEGTFIHFRTPISYWTVFKYEIEKVLDRKVHNQIEIEAALDKIWEGTKVLKEVLQVLVESGELPRSLVSPSEATLEVLLRFQRLETPPLLLLVSCLQTCTSLVRLFPSQVYSRLVNTGLLPRITNHNLSHIDLASGVSFDSATVGSYLISFEQPNGNYMFLKAYIDMLCTFSQNTRNERILMDVFLPGVVLILREVFPNIGSWRYCSTSEKRSLTEKCAVLLSNALEIPAKDPTPADLLIQKTCVYSLLHMENSVELLKIVSVGDNQLQQIMCDETNWVSGAGFQYLACMQRSLAILIHILRLKTLVTDSCELTPIEHLIFAQMNQKDTLKVIPRVTTYINHSFNKHLPGLTCRLLNRLAADFQMSLFACLDMTAYQVRVMFLNRLQDNYESEDLKITILKFVATCVSTQPGLTEAFFKLQHGKKEGEGTNSEDKSEGILAYMADYLANVKTSSSCLYSPLLSCIMALFHALWKNNMQILIKDLTENPKFWEHMTSPLFNEIQPDLRAYGQTFNVLGIELFVRKGKVDQNLKETLEQFFDTDKKHLDKWINYIFSFDGRYTTMEKVDEVPTWLSLLTSWKDFTTIFCKCLPIPLNIAHKSKMVSPCMTALLKELEDLSDSRLIVILSELYIIMLANWNEDCFDNRKINVKQVDQMLNHTNIAYDSLHPRAKRAILSIATVAISTLDYEIKANAQLAQSIIRSVTNINSLELDRLYGEMREQKLQKTEQKLNGHVNEDVAPVVLSLATLEQCLDLYDDMFSSLAQWFQSTRFVNKLLCCLNTCLQNRKHYHTSLAALRCLTAYARGPFSKDLLFSDVDQYLWMQLMPPKSMSAEPIAVANMWRQEEWWKVYAYSIDFIATMVMKHGQYFASDAIAFVGVHQEHLAEAVLLPRQYIDMEALNLCASVLNLVQQLVKFEDRWKMENMNSLTAMMRSSSVCVYHCVSLALRSRLLHQMVERPGTTEDQPSAPSDKVAKTLNRILEIVHTATLCLLSFSPDLLTLLSNTPLDMEKWQPLVELHFGAPKISYEPYPQLSFGTLLSAVLLLTKSLNHTYHTEDASSPNRSRSPRGLSSRRRPCSCSSPGETTPRRVGRSESITSVSSTASAVTAPWLAAFDKCLVANTLEAVLTLLASQALLTVKDPAVSSRDKQLVRRELSSELIGFHDFVRKRILSFSHSKNMLVRNKLGIWPLARDEEEARTVSEARRDDDQDMEDPPPPPPPPKRQSHDSMREFILRRQYLKATSTPVKGSSEEGFAATPVSHSTPADGKSKEARGSKRVSWAETTRESEGEEGPAPPLHPPYSPLTDVQVNNDEDYFHFMSVVLLYISQSEV